MRYCHFVAAFDQLADQRAADEKVTANDQRSHHASQGSAALGIIEV
jgi:hypothetical protein